MMGRQGFDYDAAGYTKGEAQARFDKQSAFCAAGGEAPWTNSEGKWKKDGKAVDDPAGPFTPGCGKDSDKDKKRRG
jgi:hypothetical protein